MKNSYQQILCMVFGLLISLQPNDAVASSFMLQSPIFIEQQVTQDSFTLVKRIALEAKSIETDRLGNLFLVSKTNQLYKYNAEGKLLSTLNYKYLGNITHVDATNPLEIYVFYKELNLVVFLDNNLAFRGELNLSTIGIGQAAAIARSYDNGLWVFDLVDLQLKKISKSGEMEQMSGNVRQYISTQNTVNFLYDNDNRVFVNDSTNGVLIFDIFANYIKLVPIRGCKEIIVINDQVYYWKAHQLHKYNLKKFTTTDYSSLPEFEEVVDLSIEQDRLYMLKKDEVIIYEY